MSDDTAILATIKVSVAYSVFKEQYEASGLGLSRQNLIIFDEIFDAIKLTWRGCLPVPGQKLIEPRHRVAIINSDRNISQIVFRTDPIHPASRYNRIVDFKSVAARARLGE